MTYGGGGFQTNYIVAPCVPSSTRSSPQSLSIRGEISPVHAPASLQCMFWAPTKTSVLDKALFTPRALVKVADGLALFFASHKL
jgi:hypothetical protein